MTNTPDTSPEAVERFTRHEVMWTGDGHTPKPSADGTWVRYEDYAALSAERDALKAELAEAVDFIQHVADGHPKDYSDNMDRARAFIARHQKETGV